MISIKEITSKNEWEHFLQSEKNSYYPFFQSWNWGLVQEAMGHRVWRMGIFEEKKLEGVAQIIYVQAKRGHYLHLRHGPVVTPFNKKVFKKLLDYVIGLAQGKKCSFIRMSPTIQTKLVDNALLREMRLRNAPVHRVDAEECWVLDITKSEEAILGDMRKSHRYLIKKMISEKGVGNKVKIVQTKNLKDIEKFLPLYKNLSKRKHFVPHRGIREEFEIFGKDDQEVLFLANLPAGRQGDKKIIAGALVAFVGESAIYRHSASDENYRDISAMYLLLWEAILEAKRRDKKSFNFWGIAPLAKPNHPWAGLTMFKTGFGGSRMEFLHTQDLPLTLVYWKTYAIEIASNFLKGY